MDGLVNIYNTTIVDEDDALIRVVNHGSSISHAGFLSDKEIFALSHDESFTVQPLDEPEEESTDHPGLAFGDLRPVLSCDYVVDIILSRQNEAVIGVGPHRCACSVKSNRRTDIFNQV